MLGLVELLYAWPFKKYLKLRKMEFLGIKGKCLIKITWCFIPKVCDCKENFSR